ncbi:phage tail protein [Pantoea sp. ICBG 1758]|uniref:phage tail assembly protein T n=1 Tax=Pantoea sp. ICBG 1758 TaxID=2071682 RepID=UPI003515AFF2
MLNGIGGKTIAEAKESLSRPEYQLWALYRHKYGSLNAGLRTEWSGGVVASVIANAHRDPAKPLFQPTDFTQHFSEPEPDDDGPISLEDAMNTWH